VGEKKGNRKCSIEEKNKKIQENKKAHYRINWKKCEKENLL
jgi:hypothetical protein